MSANFEQPVEHRPYIHFTILHHVDVTEAGDSSGDITVIQLCNRDLDNVGYFDYLQLSLNRVQLPVAPYSYYSTGRCGNPVWALATL